MRVQAFWPALFGKVLANRNLDDIILSAGGGGAAAAPAPVEEAKEDKKEAKGKGKEAEKKPEEKKPEEKKEETEDVDLVCFPFYHSLLSIFPFVNARRLLSHRAALDCSTEVSESTLNETRTFRPIFFAYIMHSLMSLEFFC